MFIGEEWNSDYSGKRQTPYPLCHRHDVNRDTAEKRLRMRELLINSVLHCKHSLSLLVLLFLLQILPSLLPVNECIIVPIS